MHRVGSMFVLLLLLNPATLSAQQHQVDECHAGFSAYVAASPYILNPSVTDRRVTTIVAVFEDSELSAVSSMRYRVTIRSAESGGIVRVLEGTKTLVPQNAAEAIATWDARDSNRNLVPDGEYVIEVRAAARRGRFLPEIDTLVQGARRAQSSEVRVIVDRGGAYDSLFDQKTRNRLKLEAMAVGLDTTFPYQFFFGTTHAHTNWSDGGMPVTDCASGRYGYAGGAQPADAFNYAKANGSIDYMAVVEHNHLMQDACISCTAEQIKTRYSSGFQAAQDATVPGSFVGLFGMEWGVISGGGHINVYNQSQLMSWVGEPYHVLVDKSNYQQLYTAMRNNQGLLGSYGSFNHPNSTDFGSYARSADGDVVIRGLSILSGPAFNTSTTFSPGGTTYVPMYNLVLSYGWKIGPEAHQDNHCQNYGNSTPNRTAVLVPNGTTFNQQSLMSAYDGRRFYAAQDRDVQLVYRTADGARAMGDSFAASAGTSIFVQAADPAGEAVQKIEIWGGRAGTSASPGAAAALITSNLSSTTLSATLAPQALGEEWYYYVTAVQADGNIIWSAPMWITWGGSSDTTPPTTSITAPAAGSTLSGTTVVTASATDDTGVSKVEFYLDGALAASDTTAPYEWPWATTTATNATHTISSKAHDAAGNTSTSANVSVTVSNTPSGDTTAPATSITAPAAGATLSGTTLVTASATDDTAVTKVEFLLDGVLAATDIAAPYEWSWNTTTATNTTHTLSSRAYDAANNSGSSVSVSITVANVAPTGTDVTGWKLVQANAASELILPAGSVIQSDGYLVVARNTTKTAFETFWGVTLPANVLFINSADRMPVINGDENFTLYNAAAAVIDGATINIVAGNSVRRSDLCAAAGVATSWVIAADTTGNPGSGAAAGCGGGVKINEFSDASGVGNFVYEFIELHNDSATADTTPPATSLSAPVSGAVVSGTTLVTATASDNVGISKVEFLLDGALQSTDIAAPYEWNWNTTATANGAHSLVSKAHDAAGNSSSSAAIPVSVDNDTTAPLASITAPAAGATVSATVPVAASASDDKGVVKVEFFLDGALAATDTTAPYEWSWNTTTASNASHSLTAKSHDAAGNSGTSAAVTVTVSNVAPGTDISGYQLTQATATLNYLLPAGTSIPARGYVVVGRNATKAAFETFWGITLGSTVVYVNSGDKMPQINGDEYYTLYNAAGTKLDGRTVAMGASAGETLRRTNGCGASSKATSWTRLASSSANPGSGAPADCGKGLYISEFSDAAGTNNFGYEFVELHIDN